MIANWQSALDYIYGLANWETRPPGTPHSFELDRFRHLLGELGNPHAAWPAVHVAGTNGKGSTCAYAANCLAHAGLRVGLYTSPHMHTVRERIQVGRLSSAGQVSFRLAPEQSVIEWLNAHRALLDAAKGLTTFEALTAFAFSHFARESVDVAVIEVGLGGTLDTTNVVNPAVCVFTPIALDHTQVLGDTVAMIARDKAGIIKSGVPVVTAPQEPAALEQIAARADVQGARLVTVSRADDTAARTTAVAPTNAGTLWGTAALAVAANGELSPAEARQSVRLDVQLPDRRYQLDFIPALPGRHQVVNAATAATAMTALWAEGWPLGADSIAAGIAATTWPGRLETLPRGRFPSESSQVIVDGAHNPHAAHGLAESLTDIVGGRRVRLILGFGGGKDAEGIVRALGPLATSIVTTASRHPKALTPDAARDVVTRAGFEAIAIGTPEEALRLALQGPPHGLDDRTDAVDGPTEAVDGSTEAVVGPVEAADGPTGAEMMDGPAEAVDGPTGADVIVATGSIFLAAAIREVYFEMAGLPAPPSDGPIR